jgi:hydrogenase/urease accessory protein HupE
MIGLLLPAANVAHAHAVELTKVAPPLVEYFRLGVVHILTGFDHLVFLLGVVWIATRTRSVLLAVTAFTAAHSLTLALSVLGFATVSPRLVEPLIALSVAYVGLENFWVRDGAQRYRITFAFGLVHGLGFAGALQEIGLPADRAPAALALFNLGVESGQLLVLSLVWPLLIWLRRGSARRLAYLSSVVNLAIVVLGLAWAVERSIGDETAVASAAIDSTHETAAVPPAPPAAPSNVATTHSDSEPSATPADLRSIYKSVPASPIAERLCRVAQRLPRERRAECTGSPVGVTFEAECTRMLSSALASGALRTDSSLDGRCVNTLEARYATCDFASAVTLPPIAACTSLWQGQLSDGAVCRSSLECQAGRHCHGVGPMETGVCGPPKPTGSSCGGAIDALASYLPTREADHPECTGRCGQGRCLP